MGRNQEKPLDPRLRGDDEKVEIQCFRMDARYADLTPI